MPDVEVERERPDPQRRATNRLLQIAGRLFAREEEAAAAIQYVSAIVALEEGQAYLEAFYDLGEVRTISISDWSGNRYDVARPTALAPDVEALLVAECRHLTSGAALQPMDARLFALGYHTGFCSRCRSHFDLGPTCRECLFAGYPINYDELPADSQYD
ncbi:MAG: hypothetical protein M3Z19_11630 [Chloroflexota bacterium]|nr:hypothetical protein [Chloroflexota bacterium]